MHESHTYDPANHRPGTIAAQGRCSWHGEVRPDEQCSGDAVVSFVDDEGQWQSGGRLALEDLVERGEIEPLGQGA